MEEWAADADAWLAALADGESVDWDVAEHAARSPQQRQFVRQLRLVARIAETYRASGASADVASSASVRHQIEFAEPAPGTRWGGLEIVGVLGRGTFGAVYRARDTRLDRIVALKLLRAERHQRRTAPSEMVNEGRLLARVRHSNVVAVFGADRLDGRVGVWMELIEGRTLEDELRDRGALSPAEVARIGLDLCRALAAVHEAGLLHRDIKTQNVMRDARDGRIVLMDLSAGRELTELRAVEASMPPSLAGSPAYLAPEVLRRQPATPQSDIYSLGVLLFRLLTRAFPVAGASLQDISNAHAGGVRTPLCDLAPDVPAPLMRIVEAAIAPTPAERFQSARAMEQALAAIAEPDFGRREQRWRRWAIAAAAAVLIGAAGLVVARRSGSGIEPATPAASPSVVLLTEVTSPRGDEAVGRALSEAVGEGLARDRGIDLADRVRVDRVLALMRTPAGTPLDVRLAREVIARDGRIRGLVAGHVRRDGTAYILTADLVDPRDGATLATVSETAAAPAVTVLARRVATRLLDHAHVLIPRLPPVTRAFEPVTTQSMKALEWYTQAASSLRGDVAPPQVAELSAATDLLRQAVEVDPAFASAWMLMARAIYAAHAQERQHWPALDAAARTASGVSDSERLLILAYWHRQRALLTGDRKDLNAAVRYYETWFATEGLPSREIGILGSLSPRDDAFLELESSLRELGRVEDADALVLRAVNALPNSMRLAAKAARVELHRGNDDRSRALALRVVNAAQSDLQDRNIASVAWARLWDASYAWLRGDAISALAAVDHAAGRFNDDGPRAQSQWAWHLSNAYQGLGRFDQAATFVPKLTARAENGVLTPDRQHSRRLLAILKLRAGDRDGARHMIAGLQSFDDLNWATGTLVRLGELDKADWVVSERKRRQVGPPWFLLASDEGALRVAQGRHKEALGLLEPLTSGFNPDAMSIWARESAAAAHLASGHQEEAIRVLEQVGSLRTQVVGNYEWRVDDWLRCRVLLVEVYRQAGRHSDAASVEAEVRRLLAVADPGHPLLARLNR